LRTNSGYDRWWEARKLWGGIVNQSRSLVQAALAYGPPDLHWRGQVVRWTAAFAYATRSRLRGAQEVPELEGLIGKEETERAFAAGHVPNYVDMRLAMLLREARLADGLDGFGLLAAEAQRATLLDHLGGCERILKTPLAAVYSVTIRRFLFVYLATTPFALLHKLKSEWLVPPATAFLAMLVLLMDQIGVELQQPFSKRSLSHLPLDEICRNLERDLWALLEEVAVHEGQLARRDGNGQPPAPATDSPRRLPRNAE
jgi:putative membrane protein